MTENTMPTPPKAPARSASVRLADLENGLVELFNTIDKMVKDLTLFREALKLLDNKVSSIIQASAQGKPVTDDVVNKIMEQNNIDALVQKVKTIVERGVLVSETEVSENSFIVGKETDAKGNVLNPRVQFALKSLQSVEMQAKIVGAQVGSTLNLEDGKVLFTVLESYKIQTPPTPAAEVAAEAPVPTEATETSVPSEAKTA